MLTDVLTNPILWTDGYKITHWLQYPKGTTRIFAYWMSRGGKYSEVVALGMQYYLKTKLAQKITMEHVDEACEYLEPYFNDALMFNRAGFERIVNVHNGHWPCRIKFAPEGMVVPTGNVLMTIESTDDQLPWVSEYLETILSLLWYPSTVATISREFKKIIMESLVRTGTPESIEFKMHDFGMRGVNSLEGGGIGGFAHLANFRGTDTLSALVVADKIYNSKNVGNSIPAAEHSTITSWGKGHEYEAFKNMVETFGNAGSGLYAVVSDSEDLMNAVDVIWGQQLKNLVLSKPNLLVVRPDSGTPAIVVTDILNSLGKTFGYTTNDKGYKVLNHVRVIQGDGISDPESIIPIIERFESFGWSMDNVAFGCGSGLLQKCDRDTQKFAIKASSATINGQIVDFRKEPVTDKGKWSKSGKLKLIRNDNGELQTVLYSEIGHDLLTLRYLDGKLFGDTTLDEIRERAKL